MRRLRYSVAMSLDGYIADDDGGYAWITDDPTIDFASYLAKIDTFLMGRKTWEITHTVENAPMLEGNDVYVVSTTLAPDENTRITVISSDVNQRVRALKAENGKDIWLFGGGVLFRSMLEAGLIDRIEVAVIPALLGSGVPLLPGLDGLATLHLHSTEAFESGVVLLKYDITTPR